MNLIPITDPSTGEEKVGALNLDAEDGNRILSCTFDEYAPPDQPRVTQIPDDNINDYKYVDGEYVYDPLPQSEPKAPIDRLGQLEADVMYLSMMTGVDIPTSEV